MINRLLLGLLILGTFVQCERQPAVEGRWKIDKVAFAGKDISKSSDPHNRNGMAFYADGSYAQFGYNSFQDTGTYTLKRGVLHLQSQQKDTELWGNLNISNDTLYLRFIMEGSAELTMQLYRLN